ncbi:50S ribosomal protein L3 [Patescibacteria group bacterium]|nr:50S ribosomal protein L3 [Patescibacteria group bacterium]
MVKAIWGKKLGMTQTFEKDMVIPVTVVKTAPGVVVQKKTKEKDGYSAIQVGFEEVKESRVSRPLLGHFKKADLSPKRYLREVKGEVFSYKVGDEMKLNVFKKGDLVKITGISKGKGFAGVMKRYGFKGGPASHGVSQWHRRPGSIGASASPSRVFKGKKMPGRMGVEKVTVRNLEVIEVNEEKNLLLIKGSIPGKKGTLLFIRETD